MGQHLCITNLPKGTLWQWRRYDDWFCGVSLKSCVATDLFNKHLVVWYVRNVCMHGGLEKLNYGQDSAKLHQLWLFLCQFCIFSLSVFTFVIIRTCLLLFFFSMQLYFKWNRSDLFLSVGFTKIYHLYWVNEFIFINWFYYYYYFHTNNLNLFLCSIAKF